jgi:hypothetical protein
MIQTNKDFSISRFDIFFQVFKRRNVSMPAGPDEFGSELQENVTSSTSAVVRIVSLFIHF